MLSQLAWKNKTHKKNVLTKPKFVLNPLKNGCKKRNLILTIREKVRVVLKL